MYGLLPDSEITKLDIFTPFTARLVKDDVISYGLSSFGYDIRLSNEFKLIKESVHRIDPKAVTENMFTNVKAQRMVVPANGFVLGRSVEYVRMPEDVFGIVLGKSTYARCGLVVNFTPLEPGWEGHITIEISNTSSTPTIVYSDEGIAQVLFLRAESRPTTSYSDRDGKYQGQLGVTLPIV